MAFVSPNITAYAVEATEYPDLARKYHVSGVPKTVVNDSVEILGALPQDAYVVQALSALSAPSAPSAPSATSGQPEDQPKG